MTGIHTDATDSEPPVTQAPRQRIPWRSEGSLPAPLEAESFVTEPLHERHAERDLAAFTSCRERLRRELQWGDWPPERFTLEDNRADLRRHHDEFVRRVAFAYMVLRPDRATCIGCVYVERCDEIDGVQLAFWVTDEAFDVEEPLVARIVEWLHTDWGLDRVLLPLRPVNARGIALARSLGLEPWKPSTDGPLAEHVGFLSRANRVSTDRSSRPAPP